MNKGKIFSGVFSVLLVIYAVVFLALLIVGRDNMEYSSFEFIQYMGANWSRSPMVDIETNGSCSINDNLISDVWPGTKAGCNCYGTVYSGYCNRSNNSFQRFCTDINPIPAIPYLKYDGFSICKVGMPQTYLELTFASDKCPTDTPKSCGSIDSLKNLLCVKANQDCPINEIKFISKSNPIPAGFKSVSLETRNLAYGNSNTLGNILIQTKISDEAPCIKTNEQSNYGGFIYMLDYYKVGSCVTTLIDTKYNTFYSQIDTYSYSKLLMDNGILTALLITIPSYPNTRYNHGTGLYIRSYIGIKPECKPKLMEMINNDVKTFNKDLQNVGATAQKALDFAITTWGLAIATFILIILWGFANLYCKCACWDYITLKSVIYLVIFYVIIMCMAIVTMSFAAVFSSTLNEIGAAHTLLTGCLDKYAEAELSNFVLSISSAKKLSMVGAIFSGLAFLFILIELLVWFKLKDSHDDDDMPNEENTQIHHNGPNDAANAYALGTGYGVGLHDNDQRNLGVVSPANNVEVKVNVDGSTPVHNYEVNAGYGYNSHIGIGTMGDHAGTVELRKYDSTFNPQVYDQNNQQLPPPVIEGTPNSSFREQLNTGENRHGVNVGVGLNVNVGNPTVNNNLNVNANAGYGANMNVNTENTSKPINAEVKLNAPVLNANINANPTVNIGVTGQRNNLNSDFLVDDEFAGLDEDLDDEDKNEKKEDEEKTERNYSDIENDIENANLGYGYGYDANVNVNIVPNVQLELKNTESVNMPPK